MQRDSNRLFGYTAKQTLDYAQGLYEKKLITYPRTGSRFITGDMGNGLSELLKSTQKFIKKELIEVGMKQTINNKKVTDHHAILPTKETAGINISEPPNGELSILNLIYHRLLVSVSKPYILEETTVELVCGGLPFKSKGRTVLSKGWEALNPKEERERNQIPKPNDGDVLNIRKAEVKKGKTSPPKHFTGDTLFSTMENASTDGVPKEVKRKEIGAPATRAGIIEKLVQKGYIKRVGDKKTKNPIPTDVGVVLVTVIPEQIQSPTITTEREEKPIGIEKGEMEGEAFMEDIQIMVRDLVGTCEVMKGVDVIIPNKNHVVGRYPHCGSEVVKCQKGWFCDNKQCRFVLWKDNALFTYIGKKINPHIVGMLLRDGKAGLKVCRSKKISKSYNADVLLSAEADGRAKFSLSLKQKGKR